MPILKISKEKKIHRFVYGDEDDGENAVILFERPSLPFIDKAKAMHTSKGKLNELSFTVEVLIHSAVGWENVFDDATGEPLEFDRKLWERLITTDYPDVEFWSALSEFLIGLIPRAGKDSDRKN